MKQLRYIMVGGFLGAGKTTTLARLAKQYMSQGLKVGIVTNDQADNLVDTFSLRSQGLPVEEVAGACFCCRFNDLVCKVESLEQRERPDIILAEPVGSCTDLVATVVQPLKDIYGERFAVAPYVVFFKPSHGLKILKDESGTGFSPKAAYIFRKQLEEADAIAINRLDELSEAEVTELVQLLTEQFPGTPILKVSAKTGQGFEELTAALEMDGEYGRKILQIDYDTYAEGEAEMGWLNSNIRVEAKTPFDLDAFLLDIVSRLKSELNGPDMEIAHLKAIGQTEATFGVANLVSSDSKPELSLPSKSKIDSFDLIVNARVAASPEILEEQVRKQVEAAAQAVNASVEFQSLQSFRPGRPMPTHRYENAVS